MPSKLEAKSRIAKALEQIPELGGSTEKSEDFIKWRRLTRIAVSNTFGEDSRHVWEFDQIYFAPISIILDGSSSSEFARVYRRGLSEVKAILESMVEEIEDYWPDDNQPRTAGIPETEKMAEQPVSNRVFVVHGRDDGTKNTVARFLEHLDLEAIILHEQPSQSRTIIDKFEKYSQVDFAVILCTPDDVGKLNSEADELRPRPRQNVVLEWGFFLGMLGRERVCALLKGEVEIPSDYDGVLHIQMEGSEDWQTKLAIELKSAGMPVDLNQIARA